MANLENNKTRKAAVNALIHWAKTEWGQHTMRDAANEYLEASVPTAPPSVAPKPSSLAEK